MIYFSIAIVIISFLVYDIARKHLKLKRDIFFVKNEEQSGSERIQDLEIRVTALEFKRMNEKNKI